ncbi:MAG TPA: bacteriohopanetetrol glucosamine biosynthesis glycosyltransferase HpnI [Steroidobacteraceae bacterium]|jgi:ceramide glucosyltransferase|nr:bacteriohopanetetrol glucosamine biosynthesis glycosyltransferase HpnI [Steroidobacteraceae bacterium]
MSALVALLQLIGLASLGLAALYAVLTLVAMLVWRIPATAATAPALPPVSVLKPLCGAEPGLYEHLRSFCRQDYAQFQIVFGVRDPADPALAVVQRLVAEFPAQPIDVVIDPQQHGSNAKVSNLINMLAQARHDVLAMADSDTCVAPDYLSTVTAPLQDRGVGLVTCLYRGVPTRQIWSRLGAMYINDWYAPSVLLAWLFGYQGYVSGQTICLRRETLQAIGGLRPVASHLADDHRLGELVRALGLRTVLSRYWLRAEHDEPNLASLIGHELRWMRTIRVLRPKSFRWMFLSVSLPLAVFGLALTALDPAFSRAAWALFLTTLAARLGLHMVHRRHDDRPLLSDCWLLPARDLLILWVWCRSFLGSQVIWRGHQFAVDADGVMHRRS